MGKYINIGNTDFASVRKDEYVDKSAIVIELKYSKSAEVLGLGISRTKVYLSELADAGFIIRLGTNKDRTYKLKQN